MGYTLGWRRACLAGEKGKRKPGVSGKWKQLWQLPRVCWTREETEALLVSVLSYSFNLRQSYFVVQIRLEFTKQPKPWSVPRAGTKVVLPRPAEVRNCDSSNAPRCTGSCSTETFLVYFFIYFLTWAKFSCGPGWPRTLYSQGWLWPFVYYCCCYYY